MSNELKITPEQAQGKVPVTILHLSGWLDRKSEDLLFQSASDQYNLGARWLLLDLSAVDTITSAGMRALTKIYKLFTPEAEQEQVLHLRMSGAQSHISHVLNITGFLKRIPHHETTQEAVDSFSQ
jgi:anti-anti-sigma factor